VLPRPVSQGLITTDRLKGEAGHELGRMGSTELFQNFAAPFFPKNKAVKSHYGESCTSAHPPGKSHWV
jgi:hypothetical protein